MHSGMNAAAPTAFTGLMGLLAYLQYAVDCHVQQRDGCKAGSQPPVGSGLLLHLHIGQQGIPRSTAACSALQTCKELRKKRCNNIGKRHTCGERCRKAVMGLCRPASTANARRPAPKALHVHNIHQRMHVKARL